MKPKYGVIGGTALKFLEGFQEISNGWHDTTHFGLVFVIQGKIGDTEVVLLPRHGPGHKTPPHQVNYIGNLVALKQLGVTDVIAVSAMGGLAPGYEPGMLVFVHDTVDKSWGRKSTVFEDGIATHIAQGICPRLRHMASVVAERQDLQYQKTGISVVIQGPQFSAPAESAINRASGAHVVAMTNQPEAKLARELRMCYVLIGQVTDLDNPPEGEGGHGVDQPEVSGRLADLGKKASLVIGGIVGFDGEEEGEGCTCANALVGAVLTQPDHIHPDVRARLCTTFGFTNIPPEWFAAH